MAALNGGAKRKRELLGVALVGLGRSGQFHLTSIRTLCHMCKLLYAVDIDEAKAKEVAEEMDCKYSTTLDAAIADPAVEIVIIASTTDTHFPFIMQSLKASKSVFAEKPISHNVKEVEEAVALALKNNKPFICGYQRRCDHNFMKMKEQVDGGKVGVMKMIKSCSRDNPVPPIEYLRTSGGIFQDMLIHDFDMHDWVTGGLAPESVTAVGHCYNPQIAEFQDLDTVAVMCKYSNGLVTMIDTCRDATYGYDQRMEIFGEKGMIHVHNEPVNTVEFANGSGFQTSPALWSFPERYKGAYLYELDKFLRLVNAGPDSEDQKEERKQMLRHPRIVRQALAAELSAKLGRTVKLSEDLDALAVGVIPHH
mmetsp:Transcript_61169/g.145680  ORF Transcript_61169/g.145680 Transcript_61169/m.145680 type:complete len:365 (+) Transcript_61169:66-1160(+)|eukprot:CAMPEP_0178427462 /NCGR_PEP_ID=MMETSP0689_2-20121128/29760_1 /TAXON_ID=160604 /ORGANISM="Amphidinium massartii, Strain CS-259" /LENGTH=364 /DNA_ID=CAMNT_0020049175 /DNA_START=65 /DNA_END=1159 /DNA_ORIENTATION=+